MYFKFRISVILSFRIYAWIEFVLYLTNRVRRYFLFIQFENHRRMFSRHKLI